MGKPSPEPFTDTEADLASEGHIAVQRYQQALADRVRRLQADDRETQEKGPPPPSSEKSPGQEEVWAALGYHPTARQSTAALKPAVIGLEPGPATRSENRGFGITFG